MRGGDKKVLDNMKRVNNSKKEVYLIWDSMIIIVEFFQEIEGAGGGAVEEERAWKGAQLTALGTDTKCDDSYINIEWWI